MSERLIPGAGYVDETGSAQRLIPGVGYVDETASSGASGTLATTNAADTSAAAGTTTVIGTLATTNANDTSDASGEVGGAVSGTSATTNANDTSSVAGTTTIVGAVAYVNVDDISTAIGVAGAISASSAQGGGSFYEAPRIERNRTVQQERERLGIITKQVKKVLVAIAKASVASEATDVQAGGLLASALAMRGLQAAPQYEQFMQQERDRILSRDIERALRIRQRQYELDEDEFEAEMLLM